MVIKHLNKPARDSTSEEQEATRLFFDNYIAHSNIVHVIGTVVEESRVSALVMGTSFLLAKLTFSRDGSHQFGFIPQQDPREVFNVHFPYRLANGEGYCSRHSLPSPRGHTARTSEPRYRLLLS